MSPLNFVLNTLFKSLKGSLHLTFWLRFKKSIFIKKIQIMWNISLDITYYITHFCPIDWQPSANNKIFFERKDLWKTATIPFSGTPFTIIGSRSLVCHQGKDRNKNEKKKNAERKMNVSIASFYLMTLYGSYSHIKIPYINFKMFS